tara:strand:+ start:333 stop:605 length:273 start_codon:yes stop_codon:yes gene_type:complete
MSRYNQTNKNISSSGKLKYQTTIYSSIPASDNDIFIMTQIGDRLDTLADQFYEDSSLWWYIAKANHLKFNNVPVGTILRIPVTLEYARGS